MRETKSALQIGMRSVPCIAAGSCSHHGSACSRSCFRHCPFILYMRRGDGLSKGLMFGVLSCPACIVPFIIVASRRRFLCWRSCRCLVFVVVINIALDFPIAFVSTDSPWKFPFAWCALFLQCRYSPHPPPDQPPIVHSPPPVLHPPPDIIFDPVASVGCAVWPVHVEHQGPVSHLGSDSHTILGLASCRIPSRRAMHTVLHDVWPNTRRPWQIMSRGPVCVRGEW